MPDFPKVRLGSRGFGVYGSFAVCVLAWTSRIPPGRVPHSERLYAKGSRSAGTGGVQWPRWFYCARGAAPNDDRGLKMLPLRLTAALAAWFRMRRILRFPLGERLL